MVCCHWPQASSFTPGIVCGPAYGRDFIDRPARPCGLGRISQNLFGPFIAARRGFLRAFHAFHGSARGNAVTDGRHLRSGSPRN